ncbi:MAG: hypothetical protein LBQ44_01080 [Treponema sp.]|nr:hypothetical protein [Treponema sp.]
MNNKKFRMMGVLAVLLIFGLVSAGCDNGLPGNEDELTLNVRLETTGYAIYVSFEPSVYEYGVPFPQDESIARSWFDFDGVDFTGSSYTGTDDDSMLWSWMPTAQSGTVTVTIRIDKYDEIKALVRRIASYGHGGTTYTDQTFPGKVTIDSTPAVKAFVE